MITKFLIIALCMLCGTMGGLFFFKRLDRRAQYFEALALLTNRIILEVKFRKSTTKNIMIEFMKESNSQLNTHLQQYLNCTDLPQLQLSKSILTTYELGEIKKFLLSLGTFDSETQLLELENYKQKFALFEKTASEKKKQFGSMSIKLGFFAGLALGVILV